MTAKPQQTVDPRMPHPPARSLPLGACDTHTHVFGNYDRFPFSTPASYPLPLAPVELYLKMLDLVGAERGVLVQPAPYGTDVSALLHALKMGHGRLRGVATARDDISDAALKELDVLGVRGLRFNEMPNSQTGKPFEGSIGIHHLRNLAPRLQAMNWHGQVWAPCAAIPSLIETVAHGELPMVFEHMGCFDVQLGTKAPAFRNLLALLAEGRVWIKLALCRASRAFPDYAELRPFHDALLDVNPDRLLWASDWPHVRLGEQSPDVGDLIDLFDHWVVDPLLRQKILVDNPARLYGFPLPTE